jgi:hypothetical protein
MTKKPTIWCVLKFHNGFNPKLQDEKTKVCRNDIFGVVEEVST